MKLYKLTAHKVNETNTYELSSRDPEDIKMFTELLEANGFTCVVTEEEV